MRRFTAVALLAGAVTTGNVAAADGATVFQAVESPLPEGDRFPRPNSLSAITSDTFEHARHKKLACLTCHLSTSQSMLTFEAPRGCQICHHQSPTRSDCSRCHEPASIPEALRVHVTIAVGATPPRDRLVGFQHERHSELDCTNCHAQSVTLAPGDSVTTCQACHADHHEVNRDCAGCHRNDNITQVHQRPVRVHVACDACHAAPTIARLSPTRSLCLVCHDNQADHQPARECVICHLQADPDQYRPRLRREGTE